MAEGNRPTISLPQVTASALAAMSSAIVLSTIGVVGTIIGAALGSVVLTTGNAIYSHYLNRSQHRLNKLLRERAPNRTTMSLAVRRDEPARDEAASVEDRTGETRVDSGPDPGGGATEEGGTREPVAVETATPEHAPLTGEDTEHAPLTSEDTEHAPLTGEDTEHAPLTGSETEHESTVAEGGPGDPPAGGAAGRWARLPAWAKVAISAASVFLVVMTGITAFELATGRTLAATVQGDRHVESGPSVLGGAPAEEAPVEDGSEPDDGTGPDDPQAPPVPSPGTEDAVPDDPTLPEPETDEPVPTSPVDPDPPPEQTENEPEPDPDSEPETDLDQPDGDSADQ